MTDNSNESPPSPTVIHDLCEPQLTVNNNTDQPEQLSASIPNSEPLDQSSTQPEPQNIPLIQHDTDLPTSIATHKSTRVKHAPPYLSDYVCNHSNTSPDPSSSGSLYPL
ncbi:hypothetical protein L195_g049252 [Trifolium pratense]|uniref:Uncharacterized protein n=1 Tax=Trifolium pratense TaxID=57577 RepID=A0A2K3JNK8_TRIPR|nr:hypothetical protein L195_g049252 [Trifolium pratense]